ncbi:SAP domain-containing ribonucleoprotein isoform X2 [Copidosoma floridanum]|uniref:SAP domain-containing ribonucleoprotein isoform X2 n=1 Tax=Copidosoma floridanum TaxID=29053 RepID=UPI0006C9782F|nr:SAP domain-containing ribonucleoprotein isoform X2 [Copidosoma floridanum]
MADSSFEKGITELAKMKVADLKAELKQRGLPTTGNKIELVERLQLAIHDTSLSLDEAADEIIDEDAVLEDEELETEELNAKPDSLSAEVVALKRKAADDDNKTPAKKIVLNRTNKIEDVKVDNGQSKEEEEKIDKPSEEAEKKVIKLSNSNNETKANNDAKDEKKDSDKKVIKLSELSSAERLEMRAKKFGVPLSDTSKKEARAARFNTGTKNSNNTGKSAASIKNTPVPASYELLKKRAERFGTNVSSLLDKAEMEAKKEQRKARFGDTKPMEKESSTKVKLVK